MQLSRRDKAALAMCAGALLLWGGYRWGGVRAAIERTDTLRRAVPAQTAIFKQLQKRCADYATIHDAVAGVQKRIPPEGMPASAASTLDRLARESGCKVSALRPDSSPLTGDLTQTRVAVRLEGVTLEQLTAFLKRIENSGLPMGVLALQVSSAPRSPDLLNADLEAVSVEPSAKNAAPAPR